MRFRCDNQLTFDAAIRQITASFAKTGHVEITTTGKRRTNQQNDCYWPWCRQIAEARDDGTSVEDVDAEVKLEKGFALRRASDVEFDDLLIRTIDKLWPAGGRWDLAKDLAKEISGPSKLDTDAFSHLLEWMQLHYWQAMQIKLEAR